MPDIDSKITHARKELLDHRGQYPEIAEAVGVHYNWIRRFASGKITEPGAIKFDKLCAWLKKNGA